MMNHNANIQYRDFYDVPRIFLVKYEGRQLLFDCPFDDELDDYSVSYRVYVMPPLSDAELEGSWENFPHLATSCLGTVPVNRVKFDPTKREAIDTSLIAELLALPEPAF
ncbi:MAG: hypothetical protein ACREEM_18440 [Blastocatellia bacterium]